MTSNDHHKYWIEDDYHLLSQATTFEDLRDVALRVLKRMPQPIGQVCGPISNGGLGSTAANLKRFEETIVQLNAQGKNIFNQMPLEGKIVEFTSGTYNAGFNEDLLTKLYLPLFESGLVGVFYFIPGWESSAGATWEHEQAVRLGIEIAYLD